MAVCVYLGEDRPPLTEGEEGGVGEASLAAGDMDGGVDESTLEPEGAASSESPWGRSRGTALSSLQWPPRGVCRLGWGTKPQGLGRVWGWCTGWSSQAPCTLARQGRRGEWRLWRAGVGRGGEGRGGEGSPRRGPIPLPRTNLCPRAL